MLYTLDGMIKGEEGGTAIDGGRRGNEDYATSTPVGVPKQNLSVVCNKAHKGRLNRVSVLLKGSRWHSLGSRIRLDLGGMAMEDENASVHHVAKRGCNQTKPSPLPAHHPPPCPSPTSTERIPSCSSPTWSNVPSSRTRACASVSSLACTPSASSQDMSVPSPSRACTRSSGQRP